MREPLRTSPVPGAHLQPDGSCEFFVWAPRAGGLALELLPRAADQSPRRIPLEPHGELLGARVPDVRDGDTYLYVFEDGRKRPDPRSRRQPQGVHGPSAVVDLERLAPAAPRRTAPFADWVIYELHVGTFAAAGTFDGVIGALPYLQDELGVNALEIMPVAPFPGERNWGYDGVAPFGVQESYGGPAGLARLLRAARERGIALILDVVYNHLGPEGNYLREFGPYFTAKHETPWGEALNFDDEGAAQVRAYFLDNALQWIQGYGFDGLRLDAVQMIQDDSPTHILAEIGEAVQAAGGKVIAESDRNDPVTVRPRAQGGYGLDAQWSDDLHHALHAALTDERTGYYVDYGAASDVAAALSRGFVYDGSRQSTFRKGYFGKSTEGVPLERHVVCLQNHDQIGNRAVGDRIDALAGKEAQKVGAAVVLLSPEIPMLFMGEEYAAPQPFLYFTSHGDPSLSRAVSRGRKYEFSAFDWEGDVPDPQLNGTFQRSLLDLEQRLASGHRELFSFYRRLLALRHDHPALRGPGRRERTKVGASDTEGWVTIERWSPGGEDRLFAICSLKPERKQASIEIPEGPWGLLLDAAASEFGGAGAAAPPSLQGGERAKLELPPWAAWVFEAR